MKKTILIILIIIALMVVTQAFISKSSQQTEQHAYQVIKVYDQFEIRKYAPALFSSVKLSSKSYKESSGSGFRVLAGYIFGDNEKNQKIAMTSPVVMELGDTTKMFFKIPEQYKLEELPSPNNPNIQFEMQPEKMVAAIRFEGWANDEKIKQYTNLLTEALKKENLKPAGIFSFRGYNPPFDLFNRRNEITVELSQYPNP